ncbi:MAG: general secretion pathway protein D, partial [Mariniblastus sp.]
MTNFWKRTASQLRQPLVCFSAFAASCLINGHLSADENGNQQPQQNSNLERIFNQDEIQFAPVPPLHKDALSLLRHSNQPSTGFGTVASNSMAPATTPTKPVSQIPFTQQQAAQGYPTALASWQEPRVGVQQPQVTLQRNYKAFPFAARVAAAPASKPRTGIHRLSQIDIIEFESAVVSTFGDRIEASSSVDGRYVRVSVPTQTAQRLEMLVDRQTQTLTYEGAIELRESWHQLVERLDTGPAHQAQRVASVPPQTSNRSAVLSSVELDLESVGQVAYLFGSPQDITQQPVAQDENTLPPGTLVPQGSEIPQGFQGVKNPVKILQNPVTGAITLVGDQADIDIVKAYIADISKKSKASQAGVARIELENVQSDAIAERLQEIYDDSYSASNGAVNIEPLDSPNSLIVVGQPNGVAAVRAMIEMMDVEGGDSALNGFRAFPLKHMSSADAKSRLLTYFSKLNVEQGDNALPDPPITVVSDFRTNTVIVRGAQQFISQAEAFLDAIDVDRTLKQSIVKIFPLKNTLAEELALVIQDAINGQQTNAGVGYNPNQQNQQQQQNNVTVDPYLSTLGATQLSLQMVGADGRTVESGIMFEVRVTADRNSNSLVVTGPENSMELVGALIEKLDRIPNAETQIKVFEIFNGDAETLLTMLESLFGADGAQQAGGGGQQGTSTLSQLPLQSGAATDGATLVNMRFSVDIRTNTIIAAGPAGDLQVVEDLLNRLDEKDFTDRRPRVYRLSNAPALDVADTIVSYLDSRNDINADDPRTVGGYLQAERSAIVVPESGSNSLLVAASPEQRAEIEELIRGLDRRPPMVKVKVLIAEVDLDTLEEFGIEVGIQDSLLFDRGTSVNAAGAITGGIGFPFNNGQSGNSNATFSNTLAGQALSNLGIGKINNSVGYGGLVLSAGSESVNVLMRALQDKQCVRVLSRPVIMTMENLQGRVQIGASVPRVSGTTQTNFGTTQNVDFEDVGVILEVTPRVSPDGMIVMAVNAIKSSVGPEETGVTIGFGANGEPIRAPQINETEAQTTLMARSGQTVVFSGLIQEEKTHTERGVPILSDLPFVGPLFKFESDSASRTELMIMLTPYLVEDEQDMATHNQDDFDRMHWCLDDVQEVYGSTNHQGYQGTEAGVRTIYPDGGTGGPVYEVIDAPQPGFEAIPPQSQMNLPATQNGGVQPASFN